MDSFFSLCVRGLSAQYRLREKVLKAVDDVNLQVRRIEVMGLAGESACGKSTLAYSILRLLPGNGEIIKGEILLNGKDILKMDEDTLRRIRWTEISIVFQGAMNALNPIMPVSQQIIEAILAHEKITIGEARARVLHLFEQVGIEKQFINSYPHELSGGMKQRIMIAMALACNPKFLILDEPSTALDAITQKKILDLIKDIQEQLNLSILLITHDLSVIAQISDRCAIMYAGKIVEIADILSIFHKPLHPYTQALTNAFPDVRSVKRIQGLPGDPPNLINPPHGCRFHPRCPVAMNICRKVEPELEEKNGHLVACHMV